MNELPAEVQELLSLMNQGVRLTPEQYGTYIRAQKPYLAAIEDRVNQVNYGTIEMKLTVRAGVVEKMDLIESRTWLKDKEKP
jgi:hypothetical protein